MILILRAEFARHSTVVSRHVDLCSLSGQDFIVDLSKRVVAGKVLHNFCLAEDRTVNNVFRFSDLEFFSCPFSKRGHDGALDLQDR